MEISMAPDLALQGSGQKSVVLATDSVNTAAARMTYAVFGDVSQQTVLKHAHSFHITPTTKSWIFLPETYTSRYGVSTAKQTINGKRFIVQTLFIPADDDWFSTLWQENGYTVPDAWLALRWSATPNNRERVVTEYRESLPDCIRQLDGWQSLLESPRLSTINKQELWQRCGQELASFEQRANTAVGFDRKQATTLQQTHEVLKQDSSHRPDFTSQAGELELQSNDTNDRYRR